jgi:hypothetical protein
VVAFAEAGSAAGVWADWAGAAEGIARVLATRSERKIRRIR